MHKNGHQPEGVDPCPGAIVDVAADGLEPQLAIQVPGERPMPVHQGVRAGVLGQGPNLPQ